MAFTIQVKKKRQDEEFGFEELELFHQECVGGKIKQQPCVPIGLMWRLICLRCGNQREITVSEAGTVKIIKTAIDGEARAVESSPGRTDVSVIQITEANRRQ